MATGVHSWQGPAAMTQMLPQMDMETVGESRLWSGDDKYAEAEATAGDGLVVAAVEAFATVWPSH